MRLLPRKIAVIAQAAMLAAVLAAGLQVVVGEQGQPAQEQAKKEDQEDKVRLQADHVRYDADAKKYILTDIPSGQPGDEYEQVIYKHKDVTLYCDRSEYDEAKDTGIAIGHLKVTAKDAIITGTTVTADFGKKIITISGNVVIVAQKKRPQSRQQSSHQAGTEAGSGNQAPAEGQKTQAKGNQEEGLEKYKYKKTTIWCDRIEYHYDDKQRVAYIRGPLKAVQEDKTAWADKAIYHERDDILEVEGNVRVVSKEGDEFRCPRAVIALDDNWMEVERVEGLIVRKKKTSAQGQGQGGQAQGSSATSSGSRAEESQPAPSPQQ